MVEILRPDGTVASSNFTGDHTAIDEATPSDTDFCYSANNTNGSLEVSLSNPSGTPGSGTVTIRYRSAQLDTDAGGGPTPDSGGTAATLAVALYDGATLISTGPTETQEGAWTANSWSPTSGEIANITNWSDVRLIITTSGGGGSPANRRGYGISWAEMEVPDPAGTDDLTAADLTGAAPTLDASTIGQAHNLTSVDITGAAPTLDASTIGQTHNIASVDLTGAGALLDAPSIGQEHALTAADLTAAAPTIDAASILAPDELTAADLTGAAPTIDAPTLAHVYNLISVDVTAAAPLLDEATIGQEHALTAVDLTAGAPTIDAATVGEPPEGGGYRNRNGRFRAFSIDLSLGG